jgi:hypothetical protein
MHHYCSMVAHSLDMQDPSPHTIPRPLQDTTLPLSPCHCSCILRCITPDLPLSHHSNAEGLVTTYRHHYCNTRTAPPRRQALEHNTNPLSLIPRHRLPCFGYIGRLLYLHSLASGSAVSQGYYKQIRPIGVDPDPRPRLFLATLVCTTLGYRMPVLQI